MIPTEANFSAPPFFGWESKNTTTYHERKYWKANAAKGLSYLPLIGSIVGVIRLIKLIANEYFDSGHHYSQDVRSSRKYFVRAIIRVIIEALSLGIILLAVDLIITICRCWKAYTKKYDPQNTPIIVDETTKSIKTRELADLQAPLLNPAIVDLGINEEQNEHPLAKQAEAFIKELWDEFHPLDKNDFCSHEIYLSSVIHDPQGMEIDPDECLGNIINVFRDDPDVLFVPTGGDDDAVNYTCPYTKEGFRHLVDCLRYGFAAGRQLVIIRLATKEQRHAIVGGFRADGQFKIIDSMPGSQSKPAEYLVEHLQSEQITSAAGQAIIFAGEDVYCNLQQQSLACVRFATLYGYQMAKAQSLDAFEQVNGAFCNGLTSFTQLAAIDHAPHIKTIPRKTARPNSHTFMESWAYHSKGFAVDNWQEIMLKDLFFSTGNHPTKPHIKGQGMAIILKKDKPPSFPVIYNSIGKPLFHFEYADLQLRIENIEDLLSQTPFPRKKLTLNEELGELIPSDEQTHILYIKLGYIEPVLFILNADEYFIVN